MGSHTLRFGGEINSSTFESLYNNANSGYALQQTNDPSQPDVNPGNAMASFLLNVPDSAGRRNVHETTRWGGVMGFYFQDSWKATPAPDRQPGPAVRPHIYPAYGKPETVWHLTAALKPVPSTSTTELTSSRNCRRPAPSAAMRPAFRAMARCPITWSCPRHGKIYHDTTTNWGPALGLAYRAYVHHRGTRRLRHLLRQLGCGYADFAELRRHMAGHRTAASRTT